MKICCMTQEERWLVKYNEVMEFVETNHRMPFDISCCVEGHPKGSKGASFNQTQFGECRRPKQWYFK